MRHLSVGNGLAGEGCGDVAKARGNIIPKGGRVGVHRHIGWHVTVVLEGTIQFVGTETLLISAPGAVEVQAHETHDLYAPFGDARYVCIGPKDF